jgi:multiple sugar transport system substrate-binding protein
MSRPAHRTGRPGRRLASAVGVLAAGSLVLTACGQGDTADDTPAAEEESSSGGDVNLRFTWWGADARAQITEDVIDQFEEKNPGITVTTEWGIWDGYWDKLSTSAAANDMPDVMQMDESKIDAYGSSGQLLDLESQPDALDVSTIAPEVLNTGDVDGTIVGAPVGIGIYSVGVNTDLLEQAGVETPDDKTWTWGEFIEDAAQVSERLGDQGVTGLDWWGFDSPEIGAFARQNGEEVFPKEGQKPVTAKTLTAFFNQALKMVETGATPQPSVQNENIIKSLEQQPFGTNKAAFHFQFHTQIQAFVDASGTELKLWRLPAVTSGKANMVNKASMYWSISADTKHPVEAAKLVDFLINDVDAAKVLGVERGVPANPDIQAAIQPQLSPTGVMATQFAADLQEEVIDPPQVTPEFAADFDAEFGRIGSGVLFGQVSPEDGAQQVLDLIKGYQK